MARALLDDSVFPVREEELNTGIPIDKDAVYYLRAIDSETARRLWKAHTKQIPNPRTHQREQVTDTPALQDALLDYCIVRWDGISNGQQPAACDLEHKRQLPILVQAALIDRAQAGQVTPEEKAASFRQPAPVVPILEG